MESQADLPVLPSVPEERESSEPLWFREIESNEDTDDGTSKAFLSGMKSGFGAS